MILADWQREVIDDLQPFCDLGTAPEATPYGDHLELVLRRNDREYRLEFRRSPAGIDVRPDGSSEVSFPELLASEDFGDLRRLANQVGILSNMRRSQSRKEVRGRSVYTYDWYVDPSLTAERPDWGLTNDRADEILRRVVDEGAVDNGGAPEATDLVFLTAQAGQGKSFALRRFHQQQAQRYLQRQASRLTFYIDAQGRGLTNLADVLARELNELRFNLPHSAILSLVRRGLVTLIVDGFDELVGARGTYEGAFSSLTTFIEWLAGKGQVIAAARSAFFTEEYLSRPSVLAGDSGSHQVSRLELVPWTATDRSAFVDRARASSPDGLVTTRVEDTFIALEKSPNSNLLARPLFSRDVLLAIIDGGQRVSTKSDLDLVSTIAENYIQREVSEKLLAQGRLPIFTADQLRIFFEDLAAEMWTLETREIDLGTARTILELRCEEWEIDPEAVRIALDRVNTLPFLTPGAESQHSTLFEHELFFSFFISASLASLLSGASGSTPSTLARARLSHDDASLLAERHLKNDAQLQPALDRLTSLAGIRHPRQGQIQVNCGTIAAALLRLESGRRPLKGLYIRGLAFDGDSFQGIRLNSSTFSQCSFNRVDLRDARIEGVADNSEFYAVLVDDSSTKVQLDGLDRELPVVQIEIFSNGRSVPMYDQLERTRLLQTTGFLDEEAGSPRIVVDNEFLYVVTQLCHAFDEMNPVGDGHTKYSGAFSSWAWPRVRAALIDHNLVRVTTKATSGPRQTFYRKQFLTSELLSGLYSETTNEAIVQFWREISTVA